jgi:hypothetical protein
MNDNENLLDLWRRYNEARDMMDSALHYRRDDGSGMYHGRHGCLVQDDEWALVYQKSEETYRELGNIIFNALKESQLSHEPKKD